MAAQSAVAIHNACAYEELLERNDELEEKVGERTTELTESHARLTRAFEELKETQASLVQSEKLASLGLLVAGVAHELNNPVSFVHGGLDNLNEFTKGLIEVVRTYEGTPVSDESARNTIAAVRSRVRLDRILAETPNLLAICSEGCERITRIVDDLRAFARPGRGERAVVQVVDGIESTVRLLENRLGAASIAVCREYQPVPPVRMDPSQVNQVWMNLLANAIDAVEGCAEPAIEIAIRISESPSLPSAPGGKQPRTFRRPVATPRAGDGDDAGNGWLRVDIRDNGRGIRPDVLQRIFDPFFTTKPLGKGTGLGLAICHGIIKNHGGVLAVSSQEGRGSIFSVYLPFDGLLNPEESGPGG